MAGLLEGATISPVPPEPEEESSGGNGTGAPTTAADLRKSLEEVAAKLGIPVEELAQTIADNHPDAQLQLHDEQLPQDLPPRRILITRNGPLVAGVLHGEEGDAPPVSPDVPYQASGAGDTPQVPLPPATPQQVVQPAPQDISATATPQPQETPQTPQNVQPEVDPSKIIEQLNNLAGQPAAELKTAQQAPASVANPDQGLTGQLDTPQVAVPDLQVPKGILAGADKAMPVSPLTPTPPISSNNIDTQAIVNANPAAQVQPQVPVAAPPGLLSEAVAQARQAGAGLLSKATATPLRVASAVAALPALAARKVGIEGPSNLVQTLQDQANKMDEGANFATGADANPTTPGQQLARIVGNNANPSGLMTGAMTAAELLSKAITPTPAAAKDAPLDRPTAIKLLTPPNTVQLSAGPRVTHTIPTVGGPASVGDGDLKLLGVMGAVTLGAIFAPKVIAAISKTPLPVFRPVANAAPGTMAMSNRIDLARTYDDVNAGVFRVARRAGVDPITLEKVQDTFRIQSGGAARNLVNSAVVNGEMQTPNFTFKTNMSVADLAKNDSAQFRDYLYARDTFDDITKKENILLNKGKNAVAQQAAIGPIQVRGMTRQDALDVVNNMEKANPEFKALGANYRENVKAMREFLNKGEYGTISKKAFTQLNGENPNYVPWRDSTGKSRVFDENVERMSPFDALKEEMQRTMRHRMENENKGLYIDAMKKVQPSLYKKITAEQLSNNPHWEKNTVTFYRRGKLERYTTDPFLADLHNLDPQGFTGPIAMGLYASKRLMEATATGTLAPWFAATSALRSWQIGKITTPVTMKPPTLLGSVAAVPKQLYPQLAKSIGESLENGSGGWLGQVLGPQTMQAISVKLADVYDRSLYAQLEHAGTHQGSFLQHAQEFNGAIAKAAGMTTGSARTFLTGYKQMLNAIHNSPSFDFASKNFSAGMPLPKLAMEARHLTGDPMVAGQFLRSKNKPIRMDKPLLGSDMAGKAATAGTQFYGFLTGIGREAIPWWNITTQGAKRIGEAYLENPTKFVAKTYAYQIAPAAALFMYTRGLGKDSNGQSYNDYMMNRRSEYAKLMNWYVPIPGRPAEDGMEIPRFHELTIAAHGIEVALDHVTRSSVYQSGEDFMRTALAMVGAKDYFPTNNAGSIFNPMEDAAALGKAFSEAAIIPPTPPIVSAPLAMSGMVAPQGIFGGGDTYKKKQDPYDQLGGMNATLELVTRALGTGLADVIGSGYAAYTQTPKGVLNGIENAMSEGSKRMIMKTPIVRDAFDVKPPASGNTRITEELFKKEKVINDLSKYFRTWSRGDEKRGPGELNIKPASESGGRAVNNILGSGPPSESAGLDQPPPTNPLYLSFIEELYNKMNKDSPERKVDPVTGAKSSRANAVWAPDPDGGIGMKSLWRRYGSYSTDLKRLRSVNDGNNVTWQMQLSQRPDQVQYLKDNNIDYKDVRTVRNFYESKRQEVARQILFAIRAVEEDFSNRLGKPFHVEDLDPYAKTPQAGEVINEQPTIPPWADGMGLN